MELIPLLITSPNIEGGVILLVWILGVLYWAVKDQL